MYLGIYQTSNVIFTVNKTAYSFWNVHFKFYLSTVNFITFYKAYLFATYFIPQLRLRSYK